jgi:hypothetical protein
MPDIGSGGTCDLERVLGLVAYPKAIVGHPHIQEPAPAIVQPKAAVSAKCPEQGPGFEAATSQGQVMQEESGVIPLFPQASKEATRSEGGSQILEQLLGSIEGILIE